MGAATNGLAVGQKVGTASTAEQRMVRVRRVHMRMQLCTPVLLRPPQEGPLAALCCL